MQLHLVFLGKTQLPAADQGIERYLKRLQHYRPVTVHQLKAARIGRKTDTAEVQEQEALRIDKLVPRQDYLVAWDERGEQMSSLEFSRYLQQLENAGVGKVWMVLGGPLGLAERIRHSARRVLSLSRMTLAHDLARLVVVEQLYRAFTILKGEPYHK